MSTCNACGSVFTTFERQTRSADEAQTVVSTCPNCPVNANRLNSTDMPLPSFRGLVRPVNRRSLQVEPCRPRSRNEFYTLSFDVPQDHAYHSMELGLDYITKRVVLHRRSVSETSTSIAAEAHHVVSGIRPGFCSSFRTSTDIGIGAKMNTYEVYDVPEDARSLTLCKGTFSEVDTVRGHRSIVQHTFTDRYRTLEVEIGNNTPSVRLIESITRQVYSAGVYPSNVKTYLGGDRVSKLANLSARAWDTNVAPESGYVFTAKPDGQRMWMIWSGHVWYVCNPRLAGCTGRWLWSNRLRCSSALVVDVEYVLSRGFMLIDFLTTVDGLDAPIMRDLSWVLSQYTLLQAITENVPFYPRQYFETNGGAVQYTERLLTPCDGTVAIRDGSTEILKIKAVKSVELVVANNGTLDTSNGATVMKCPARYTFEVGDIVEVRFTVHSDMRTISILDMFKRVDKSTANDTTAVSNIIQSSITSRTPDDNERRVALLWCNELRRYLQSLAVKAQPTKSIILDVGTGNGQSLDAVLVDERVSYVFLEPDSRSCAALARRLGIRQVYTDPWELVPVIRALKTRSVQYVVLNCRLQDLISCERACETLLSETKCITATFSAHYVVEELQDIVSSFCMPVYACTYVYDSAVSDILVDDCGVSMRVLHGETAEVKWGGDRAYTEPVTYMRDYSGIGTVVYAEQHKQLPLVSSTPGAYNICRSVMIVTPY